MGPVDRVNIFHYWIATDCFTLAHVIGNKAEAAYRRGDLFDKRRKLMDEWAAFAESKQLAMVLPMKR